MPQRTNAFQQLVYLIQASLLKEGETIEESAMVKVQGLDEREIDILVKSPSGLSTIKIAVEAKKEKRKLDVGKLDALVGKYRGEGRVCADKLIVVSASGFTQPAIDKAKLLDVTIYTLKEACALDWSYLRPPHPTISTLSIHQEPHFHKIEFSPPLPVHLHDDIIKNGRIVCGHNRDHGSVIDYLRLHTYASTSDRGRELMRKLKGKSLNNYRGAIAKVDCDLNNIAIRHNNVDYPVHRFFVDIHMIAAHTNVKCDTLFMKSEHGGTDRAVQQISGAIGDTPIRMVFEVDPIVWTEIEPSLATPVQVVLTRTT